MNKLLICLLLVCLVSVHAFVKRDAPETATQSIIDQINKNLKSLGDSFDGEKIKAEFNKFVASAQQAIDGFAKKAESNNKPE